VLSIGGKTGRASLRNQKSERGRKSQGYAAELHKSITAIGKRMLHKEKTHEAEVRE